MACASPRVVVWVGEKSACDSARELFWAAVEGEMENRSVQYPEVLGLNKLVSAHVVVGAGLSDEIACNPVGFVNSVHPAPDASSEFRKLECSGGFFFEADVPSLFNDRDQTLSYFGFSRDEFRRLALSISSRALHRIVPIGSALDFNTVWDGSDFLQVFTREVDVR